MKFFLTVTRNRHQHLVPESGEQTTEYSDESFSFRKVSCSIQRLQLSLLPLMRKHSERSEEKLQKFFCFLHLHFHYTQALSCVCLIASLELLCIADSHPAPTFMLTIAIFCSFKSLYNKFTSKCKQNNP